MLLFKESVADQPAPRAPARRQTRAQIAESNERGCDACPLKDTWDRLSTPRMPMSGNRKGDILVIGEAPGEDEDIEGKVFVGRSGKFLRDHLPMRHQERLAFTNSVRCRPPGNRNPTGLELHCCSVHLEEDVRGADYRAVLLVGGAPLSKFILEASITQIHGIRFPVEIGGNVMWAFPVFHPSFLLHMGGSKSWVGGNAESATPFYPCFASDLKRFFREVDRWREPEIEKISPGDVQVARSEHEVREAVAQMRGVLGFDIETSVLKPYMRDAKILSASFSDGQRTVAFPVEHPFDPNTWALPLVLELTNTRPWVAHQAAFEFIWMLAESRRLGVPWRGAEMDDSMALGRLYYGRSVMLGLGIMSRIVLGVDVKKLTPVDSRRIMDYPLEEVLPYHGLDAWASARIQRRLRKSTHEDTYLRVVGASRSVAHMELLGLPIDEAEARAQKEYWSGITARLQVEAEKIYEVRQFVRERQAEFRLGATNDVAFALTQYGQVELPRTRSGKSAAVDEEVLSPLATKNPLARLVLDYREAQKHESTYVDPVLRARQRHPDGMLHPAYTTVRTETLRLSSGRDDEATEGDTNIQNWPKRRHRELRRMICAPPGHVIVAADSGQIQARVFGMASRDRALCQSFIDHDDIHSHWLDRFIYYYPRYVDRLMEQTNTTDEKVIRKKGRDVIKYDFVFASFFGQTANSCAEKTGIPLAIIREILDTEFWGGYPDAFKWLKARRAEYRDTGSVATLTGRVRRGVMSGNEPIITPIQGGEAELVIAAQNELSQLAVERDDLYLHPRLMVHDDLSFIMPDDDARLEEYISVVVEAMNRVRYPWQIVPLTTEVSIGYNWADLTEIQTFEGDYVR
jgi:uracil-DNA glycosylase